MFARLFKKKPPAQAAEQLMIAKINARLQPMHRGEFFEDPLDVVLKAAGNCEVSGGGTQQAVSGEIEYCDIEIQCADSNPATVSLVVSTLEGLGAPKGSALTVASTGEEIPFGSAEGLAVYLNGTDLPPETYRECDSNHVYAEFDRLLDGEGRVLSYWEGPRGTAFYMYGKSFETMKRLLSDFIAAYPLCAQCRIEQVA